MSSRIAKGIELIKKNEGLRLKAYLCPANKWTIGWGNTFYEDGTPVKQGDVVTREEADKLFQTVVDSFASQVLVRLKKPVTDNQLSALLSFAYNAGIGAFERSTLLKKVNANPDDPTIRNEFMRWVKANNRPMKALIRRRGEEADLYFTP